MLAYNNSEKLIQSFRTCKNGKSNGQADIFSSASSSRMLQDFVRSCRQDFRRSTSGLRNRMAWIKEKWVYSIMCKDFNCCVFAEHWMSFATIPLCYSSDCAAFIASMLVEYFLRITGFSHSRPQSPAWTPSRAGCAKLFVKTHILHNWFGPHFNNNSIIIVAQPMGQLPTLETEDGLICQSNVIARHIARKYGKFLFYYPEKIWF